MRAVKLVRKEDVTGVSGTGVVAEGIIFSNNQLVLHWLREPQSIVVWDNPDDAIAVHGHDGKTELVEVFLEAFPAVDPDAAKHKNEG